MSMISQGSWRSTAVALAVGMQLVTLAGCDKLNHHSEEVTVSAIVPAPASGSTSQSDSSAPATNIGTVTHVHVRAEGIGASPDEALSQALRQAIMQVNGTTLDLASSQFRAALTVSTGRSMVDLQSSGFAELVQQESRGAISDFRVTELRRESSSDSSIHAVIEANVAKFKGPDSEGRPRIIVAPIRISGNVTPALNREATLVRQRITDALTQSGRFIVLEHGATPEIDAELERIANGQASPDQFSKLGQGVGADLVWVGRLNALSPTNALDEGSAVRGRGEWSISQQLVNVTTSEVLLSDTTPVDQNSKLADGRTSSIENSIASKVVSSILVQLFPVSIASRDGINVVLSQGGQSVKVGASYQVVSLGKAIKDPQTGRMLGRTEQECCTVVVDRVAQTLSYGHLENMKISPDELVDGNLELRQQVASVAPPDNQRQSAGTQRKGKSTHRGKDSAASERDDDW
ncbi:MULTISPECIES: CsgG/HfaB family protein [Pandoraea]|nr:MULTISPECIES: CsgG/HfaB family protein [Pandoraea]